MIHNYSSLKCAALLGLVTCLSSGCKTDPAPPTIDNAKTMWHSINEHLRLQSYLALDDMTKTDGQMAEINGVKVYTLFYEAKIRHLIPMGNWKPGDVETIHSNYGFQRTEKGWQAGDGEVFQR